METVEEGKQIAEAKTETGDGGSSLDTGSSLDNDPYHYTKRGAFTSELFKIEITNLPRYYGYVELKKRLEKLGVKPRKLKKLPNSSVTFATFDNEEKREAALAAIKGHLWKKSTLDAKIAKPVADPVTMKRKNESEGTEEPQKKPKISVEDSVTPLVHLPYEEQLNSKQRDMEEFLNSLAKDFHRNIPQMRSWLNVQRSKHDGKCCALERIKPSPIIDGYRNKCEFTIGKDKTIGFRVGKYRDGFTTVASPMPCRNVPPAAKKVVEHMQAFLGQSELQGENPVTHEGHWSILLVRTTEGSEVMASLRMKVEDLTLEEFEATKKNLQEYFSPSGPGNSAGITSLYLLISGKRFKAKGIDSNIYHIAGNAHITENLLGLKFQISHYSFFQVNTQAAEVLFQTAGDWAEVSQDTVLLDVCCGTGTIGLSLAKRVKRVVGVDICKDSIKDAKVNATNNGITNATYVCGKAEVELPGIMDTIRPSEMVVGILDPPRAGMHMKVIQAIRKCSGLRRLVFLSCNPQLASRNFIDLCRPASNNYKGTPFRLTKAIPVDLFPHAKHCELILLFQREDEISVGDKTDSKPLTEPSITSSTIDEKRADDSSPVDVEHQKECQPSEGQASEVKGVEPLSETPDQPSLGKSSDESAIHETKDGASAQKDMDAMTKSSNEELSKDKGVEKLSVTLEQPLHGKSADESVINETKDSDNVQMEMDTESNCPPSVSTGEEPSDDKDKTPLSEMIEQG